MLLVQLLDKTEADVRLNQIEGQKKEEDRPVRMMDPLVEREEDDTENLESEKVLIVIKNIKDKHEKERDYKKLSKVWK